MIDREILKRKGVVLLKKPVMCVKRRGMWKVWLDSDEVAIVHSAKQWLEARELEDFYTEHGIKVYRLNMDIEPEAEIAEDLLARCPKGATLIYSKRGKLLKGPQVPN